MDPPATAGGTDPTSCGPSWIGSVRSCMDPPATAGGTDPTSCDPLGSGQFARVWTHPLPQVVLTRLRVTLLDRVSTTRGSGWVRSRMTRLGTFAINSAVLTIRDPGKASRSDAAARSRRGAADSRPFQPRLSRPAPSFRRARYTKCAAL